jgi:hypothetical protein
MKFVCVSLINAILVMASFKYIAIIMLHTFLFSSCSTAQKLLTKSPIEYDEVYFQKWAAGIKEGGSGMNLFIPIKKELSKSIQLDSVYFKGKGVLLQKIEGKKTAYVGRFKFNFNHKKDTTMSSVLNEEYGNQAPILKEKIPFDLKDSECVVSYKEGNETKYFKIENVIEKQPQNYPGVPNKQ